MNCEEFRTAVATEPNTAHPDVLAHAEQCPACAQYRLEMQDMDRLIHRALNVSVPTQLPRPHSASRRYSWKLAASVLVTVSIALSIWLATARPTFAEQLIEHVRHEPNSLLSSVPMETASVDGLLSSFGLRLKPHSADVSYAMSCWLRGHEVPHMVVLSERGPVTVLVLQDEPTPTTLERFDEDGYQGVVMPAPRGVLVVLGQNVPVDTVAKTLLDALEYVPRAPAGATSG
jgi:hypothetical protein